MTKHVLIESLVLESGKKLESFKLCYETYGNRNQNSDNAILLNHALTGSHQAASANLDTGKPGWWGTSLVAIK